MLPARADFPGIGREPSVANLTELQAASSFSFPFGVWRLTYGNGNGAPPLFYQPSNSACSLNAGAGDNGSQVQSADGKCWLAQFPIGVADPREFGADPTGTNDSSAAFSSAAAATGNVQFPPGTFKLASPVTYNFSTCPGQLHIVGAGPGKTILLPSGDGLYINYNCLANSIGIEELSFRAAGHGGHTALVVQNTNSEVNGSPMQSQIRHVEFSGADACDGDYWSYEVVIHSVGGILFDNDVWCGGGTNFTTGVYIDGSPQTLTTNATTSSGSAVLHFAATTGVLAGMYAYDTTNPAALTNIEVLSVTGTTVTLVGNVPGTVNSGDTIVFVNIAAVYNFIGGEFWDLGQAIWIGSGVQGLMLGPGLNCLQIANTQSACLNIGSGVVGLDGLTITGVAFEASGFDVITLSNFYDTVITDSIFYCSSTTLQCIYGGPSSRFSVTGNHIVNPNPTLGAGGVYVNGTGCAINSNIIQNFAYGVYLDSAATQCMVTGNTLVANTHGVGDASTAATNVIANNLGYNPVGVTFGTYTTGTGATYTAGPSPETHYLTGGTVTAVKVPPGGNTVYSGTSACGTAPCIVQLGPNETMSVTYSAAPNDTKSVH